MIAMLFLVVSLAAWVALLLLGLAAVALGGLFSPGE